MSINLVPQVKNMAEQYNDNSEFEDYYEDEEEDDPIKKKKKLTPREQFFKGVNEQHKKKTRLDFEGERAGNNQGIPQKPEKKKYPNWLW